MSRPPLIFRGLRYPRSMAEAFSDVRAGCIEYHTRPSWIKRVVRAIWRR